MFATREISDTIRANVCCHASELKACEYCPYFDDMDPLYCSHRLYNDISYYLGKLKKMEEPTEEEQPYLPGIQL